MCSNVLLKILNQLPIFSWHLKTCFQFFHEFCLRIFLDKYVTKIPFLQWIKKCFENECMTSVDFRHFIVRLGKKIRSSFMWEKRSEIDHVLLMLFCQGQNTMWLSHFRVAFQFPKTDADRKWSCGKEWKIKQNKEI